MIANCYYDVIKTGKILFKDCKNANDFEVDEIGENKDENCNRIICVDCNTNNPWFKLKGTDYYGEECYLVAHDRAEGAEIFWYVVLILLRHITFTGQDAFPQIKKRL